MVLPTQVEALTPTRCMLGPSLQPGMGAVGIPEVESEPTAHRP